MSPALAKSFSKTTETGAGVLVECDPAIKAIILKIDEENHNYIVEDLDDQHLVIKENQLNSLKKRLEEVFWTLYLTESTMCVR